MAAFRSALRRFLHKTEAAAHAAGLTAQRYDLLLMIKAAPDGSETSTVTNLCDHLDLQQTAVTELVKRTEKAGLLARVRSVDDGRVYHLRLTEEGEGRLLQVFSALASERHDLVEAFRQLNERLQRLSGRLAAGGSPGLPAARAVLVVAAGCSRCRSPARWIARRRPSAVHSGQGGVLRDELVARMAHARRCAAGGDEQQVAAERRAAVDAGRCARLPERARPCRASKP